LFPMATQKHRHSVAADGPNPPKACARVAGKLDRGIKRAVELLRAGGVETFESCEGGEGHAYAEPTVAFVGGPYAGWLAMSICLANGLPVASLRRVWMVEELNDVTGPRWEVVFRSRLA
jgi:NADPH-dependent 2,4-dienoyl-CoA reductase/sulfur reductase-like enzyme